MAPEADSLRTTIADALGPEFALNDILGRGGFATVYRARDLTLQRDVAVKVLSPDHALSDGAAEHFLREARTIAGLEHAHIVPVYRAGITGSVLYIVMRIVPGRSLAAVVAERPGRSLPWPDALRIATQAADALSYAHARGIVHRDVKPDNLLLDGAGNVLLTDFGIALALAADSELTVNGVVSGTPRYMSPEQALGDAIDARADVYALGIVLYEMLAGRPPFGGGSSAATLKQQMTGGAPPIDAPDVPPPLRTVVARALDKDPTKRFADAGAMRDALTEVRRSADKAGLRRTRSILAAAVVVALVALSLLLWRVYTRDKFAKRKAALDLVGVIPDSMIRELRALKAVRDSERVRYVFAPAGATIRNSFILTDGRMIRVAPSGVRAYARAEYIGISMVRSGDGSEQVILVLQPAGGGSFGRDTLFSGLGSAERSQLYEKMKMFRLAK